MTLRNIVIQVALLCLAQVKAGDYSAYRAQKVTYEYTTPFDDKNSPKLDPVTVTITTKKKRWGNLGRNTATHLGSVSIKIGKTTIDIPEELLNHMDEVSLDTIDF